MASLKRKQTLFSGVARKAKEIRQNSTNLAFDNKTNARKGSKIATADARLAIYVFYLSMVLTFQSTKLLILRHIYLTKLYKIFKVTNSYAKLCL